ncbi:MAG: aminotransferase class V-fold PLP-dependent enzyme [Bradymonadaceae bacterium]
MEYEPIDIDWTRHWLLDPGVIHLNHGSFGACPKGVLSEQSDLRKQLERQPVAFFDEHLRPALDRARGELAAFIGSDTAGLAFVSNATTGINAILRSLAFDPGDEIVVLDQAYPACRNAATFVADRAGAEVVRADLPYPLEGPGQIVEALTDALTPRTELALIDHVPSSTGVVLPLERILEVLDEQHVTSLIDGAHAPGSIDLDLEALEPTLDFYVGNCHKWLCAPKGAAFLWTNPHDRDGIHPPVISNGYGGTPERTAYHAEFDWTGTRDPTPFLCVPEAIDYMGGLVPDGWEGVRSHNHALALRARDRLCDTLGIDPPVPDDMMGPMASVPLPGAPPDGVGEVDPLERRLAREHGIVVPVKSKPTPPRRLLRVSAQIYNHPEQYEALADALDEELAD